LLIGFSPYSQNPISGRGSRPKSATINSSINPESGHIVRRIAKELCTT
jgi:hypothetical protein